MLPERPRDGDEANTRDGHIDPKYPSPGSALGKGATDERTKDGAECPDCALVAKVGSYASS